MRMDNGTVQPVGKYVSCSEWNYRVVSQDSFKTHTGSVWKVTWAHPEFGKILATCSFDRTTAIWEEIGKFEWMKFGDNRLFETFSVSESGSEKTQSHWLRRYVMVDSRANVTDVKFGPKHLGLMLVSLTIHLSSWIK